MPKVLVIKLFMMYLLKAQRVSSAFVAALLATALLAMSFFVLEPVVSRSATDTDTFLVTQTITAEISFEAATGDVTMNGSIAGITGGTAYGTTTARVLTNNATGYNMTVQFSSTTAMTRNNGGGWINNYQYSTGTVSYPAGFASAVYSQFGFSVNASNTAEVSGVFTGSAGVDCGTSAGSTFTVNDCWRGASTTDETYETQLINSSLATPSSGSTSTVQFRVIVPNTPSPTVPSGTYTATATLTATTN